MKQKMELDEMKRLAEERKRQKFEDRMARQKIREQIARDRKERDTCSKPVAVQPQPKPTAEVKKDYNTCRLQIKLLDGTATIHSFNATDTLHDVVAYLDLQGTKLQTTFPRKIFSTEDEGKTLKDLGLVPSAVLIQRQN